MRLNLEILDAFLLYSKDEIEELNTKVLVPQMVFRRRLTRASKLVIESLSGIDAKNLRIVHGSSFGELLASANILKAILEDDMLSPTDFQNSVYNTAVSYASILFENKNEIMTISSGDETSLKVLKAGAIKALDGDELALVCSEAINIPNIDEINSCAKYLECVVALRVRSSSKEANLSLDGVKDDGFVPSLRHMVFVAKNFNKNSILAIDI